MSGSGTPAGDEWDLGVQSSTYREQSVAELSTALRETPVTDVELCPAHVRPDASGAAIEERLDRIDAAGMDVCGYGVAEFEGNPEDAETTVDLVDRLDGEYLSLSFDPGNQDVVDALLEHADDYDMDLAVHNGGPDSEFPTVDSIDAAISDVDDAWLGACVDAGNYLRADEPPNDVISTLGDRVYALHLTDVDADGTEAVPGEGRLDVADLLSLLSEHASLDRPLVIEYAGDPSDPEDDPTAAVNRAAESVLAVTGSD